MSATPEPRGIWNEKMLGIVRGAVLKPVKDLTNMEDALLRRFLTDYNEEELDALIAEARAS